MCKWSCFLSGSEHGSKALGEIDPGRGLILEGGLATAQDTEEWTGRARTPGLTVLCEMVRQPYLTPHFLFCQTLRILRPEG